MSAHRGETDGLDTADLDLSDAPVELRALRRLSALRRANPSAPQPHRAAPQERNMTTSNECQSAIRALAIAVRDGHVTCRLGHTIHVNNIAANDFQLLTLSVLHEWGWITWTFTKPPAMDAVAVLTALGERRMAEILGPDLSDPVQWRQCLAGLFAVSPQEIADETGDQK